MLFQSDWCHFWNEMFQMIVKIINLGVKNCLSLGSVMYCRIWCILFVSCSESTPSRASLRLHTQTKKAWTLFNWQIPARWTKFYVQNTLQRYVLNWIELNWTEFYFLFYFILFTFVLIYMYCIVLYVHCVSKKLHPFYFRNNFVDPGLIWIIFGSDTPEENCNKTCIVFPTTPIFCAPTVRCKTSKLSDWHSQWWTPKWDGKVR